MIPISYAMICHPIGNPPPALGGTVQLEVEAICQLVASARASWIPGAEVDGAPATRKRKPHPLGRSAAAVDGQLDLVISDCLSDCLLMIVGDSHRFVIANTDH